MEIQPNLMYKEGGMSLKFNLFFSPVTLFETRTNELIENKYHPAELKKQVKLVKCC